MGIAVTLEALDAPVPHVTLLKPCKALFGVANRAYRDTALLTV
jgi:hypothetical protein